MFQTVPVAAKVTAMLVAGPRRDIPVVERRISAAAFDIVNRDAGAIPVDPSTLDASRRAIAIASVPAIEGSVSRQIARDAGRSAGSLLIGAVH